MWNVPPEGAIGKSPRLMVLVNAGAVMAAAAVYAGYKLKNGGYSCTLLKAKSCCIGDTVPRNKLNTLVLGAEFQALIQHAFFEDVDDVLVFSDSIVSLSWIKSMKRLKPYVLARVMKIRRLRSKNDFWFMPTEFNVADIATKGHVNIEMMEGNQRWMSGDAWMHSEKRELSRHDQIHITDIEASQAEKQTAAGKEFEKLPDVMITQWIRESSYVLATEEEVESRVHNLKQQSKDQMMTEETVTRLDVGKLGWKKTVKAYMMLFKYKLWHRIHVKNDTVSVSPQKIHCTKI